MSKSRWDDIFEQDGTYGHPLIIESLVQGLKRERATERERDRKTDTLTQQRREREKRERIDLFMILKHSPGGAWKGRELGPLTSQRELSNDCKYKLYVTAKSTERKSQEQTWDSMPLIAQFLSEVHSKSVWPNSRLFE